MFWLLLCAVASWCVVVGSWGHLGAVRPPSTALPLDVFCFAAFQAEPVPCSSASISQQEKPSPLPVMVWSAKSQVGLLCCWQKIAFVSSALIFRGLGKLWLQANSLSGDFGAPLKVAPRWLWPCKGSSGAALGAGRAGFPSAYPDVSLWSRQASCASVMLLFWILSTFSSLL